MLTRRLTFAALLTLPAAAMAQTGRKTAEPPAPESVDPFASPNDDITGTYRSHGMESNGRTYTSEVIIKRNGGLYEFIWHQAGNSLRGAGTRDGRVLTIDWGADTPVIYVVMPDGELHGTWDDGRALEKLIPN